LPRSGSSDSSSVTSLSLSDCADYTAGPDGAGFAQELDVGIKDNGALSKLTFGGGNY
jgi:hypothetical protein